MLNRATDHSMCVSKGIPSEEINLENGINPVTQVKVAKKINEWSLIQEIRVVYVHTLFCCHPENAIIQSEHIECS